METLWAPVELKNCKLKNPSLLFGLYSSISRKQQATGFEPLRHILEPSAKELNSIISTTPILPLLPQ